MNFFKRLVTEAHRRSLWQVLGIYLAVAWAVFEASAEITERMGLPDWVPGFAFVLLLIGLPIVLATAFIQEGAPALRSTRRPDPVDPTLLPMDWAPEPARKEQHIFTWQKAALGGIFAFLLLGITAGGYMGLRNAGIGPFGSLLASGDLDAREPILIAEFRPLNGDTMLATTVTEAFRVDFTQSSAVTVVEPKHVREVLQRMSRDPKARVDAELAHEIAVRDNIKTYLLGEVSQAGEKYVVAGKLLATGDGRVLASYRETAAGIDDMIGAVDRLSKKLRSKIGESLRTIRAEKPLEAVSTPSLDALQKYTQAAYAIDTERNWDTGISLLQEAIELDSAFAMAWRKLAVAYGNSGRGRELAVRAATKAYEFRDRLTDAERYHATAFYFHRVKGDWEKAINAYRMLEDRDPRWPPNNLGISYIQVREYQKAADAFRRSIAKDSTLHAGYENLAEALAFLGDFDGVDKILTVTERRFKHADAPEYRALAAAARHDYATAEAEVRKMLEATRTSPVFRARANWQLASLAHVRGELTEGKRFRNEVVTAELERGNSWAALDDALWEVWLDFAARRNPDRALATLEAALQEHSLEAIPAMDRPYLDIAGGYALLGKADRARHFVAQYEAAVPDDLRGNTVGSYATIEGAIALHEKRFDAAIAAFRKRAATGLCSYCGDTDLALAFEQAAMPDSAIARYEHYLSTPSLYRIWSDGAQLASVYERLAELHASKGDRQNAARYAAKFVELWQNADPEFQPRVQAKRRMLQEIEGTTMR
jgi:tetratricopeptide (TPR) repeat protein